MYVMHDCGNVYTQQKTLNRTENEFPFYLYPISGFSSPFYTYIFFF